MVQARLFNSPGLTSQQSGSPGDVDLESSIKGRHDSTAMELEARSDCLRNPPNEASPRHARGLESNMVGEEAVVNAKTAPS